MSIVDLVVDVDRAVRGTTARDDRIRQRHVLTDRTVYVGVAHAGVVTARSCGLDEWRLELAKLCRGPASGASAHSGTVVPDLPWELLVATGRALAEHRLDLYDELVARADLEVRPVLSRLHQETVGRLRVVGTLPTRRRVGWVSWVLLPDGWRALTPYVGGTAGAARPMVRLERRGPEDLVDQVVRWTAEARR